MPRCARVRRDRRTAAAVPPPPTPAEPISHEKSPTDAAASREQHPPAARADELQLVRASASPGATRLGGGLASATQLVGLQCGAARSRTSRPCASDVRTRRARATRTPENMVANAAPNSPRIAPGCFTSSSRIDRRNASGRKRQPVERHGRGRRVHQPAVQGCGPRGRACGADACAPDRRRAARRRRGGELDARLGHDGDAVPRQAGANTEVEGVVDGRERRDRIRRAPARRRAGRGWRPDRGRARRSSPSCWPWSSSSSTIGTLRPRRVMVRPNPAIRPGSSHSMSFGPADRDGLGRLERGEQRCQRVRLGRGVFGEQPERVRVRRGRVEHPLAGPHGLAEREGLLQRRRHGWRRRRRSARGPRRRPARARPRARRVCAPAHGSRRGCAGGGRRRGERRGRR